MPLQRLLCAMCALAAVVLPSRAAPAPTVPLAAFVYEDQVAHPRLAPDGKHVALTVRIPDGDRFVPVVMIYALPGMRQTGAVRMPSFQVPADYVWITNTRLAISKGRELGSRERPVETGEILAVDIDGGKQQYLYGRDMRQSSSRGSRYGDDEGHGYIENVPREANGRLYVTANPWEARRTMLYDVDSRSAVRTLVADVPHADLRFVLRADGAPRYAFGVDDNAERLVLRHNDQTRRWDDIGAGLGQRYVPLMLGADDALYVRYSPDGGPDQLIREDGAGGKRRVLFADPEASVDGLLFGSRFGAPFGARSTIGRPRPRYFDEQSADAQLHKALSAQFPDHYVGFADASADGSVVLFSVASDRDPGSYYLLDRKSMKADLLFSALERIDPAKMAPRLPVSFKARDGLALHGFLTMPTGLAAGAKPPLVLVPHGGPHGPYDDWFYDNDAQFLASRGYAVLQVNFRGSGGRGVDFLTAGFLEWGGKIQDDLVDGVRWAIASGQVDGARVCAVGTSFGGYSALMLAALQPDLFKCAVGYAGVYDLNLLSKPENNRLDERMASYYRKYVGNDKAKLAANSPTTLAARIKAPVMLVHGGNDKNAPVAHAHAMRAALVQAGATPEWFLAPNEGHGFYDTRNVTEFYQRLESFLGKHLQ